MDNFNVTLNSNNGNSRIAGFFQERARRTLMYRIAGLHAGGSCVPDKALNK
jgi:hypothetical protein